MNELDPNLRKKFEDLTNQLSPENLTCDGECSQSQVQMRVRRIHQEWAVLERKAGRKVSQAEIDEYQYKRWRSSSMNDIQASKEVMIAAKILADDEGWIDVKTALPPPVDIGMGFKVQSYPDGMIGIVRKEKTVLLLEKEQAQRLKRLL